MTNGQDKPDWEILGLLPAHDPLRAQAEQALPSAAPEERARAEQLKAEGETLRAALARVDVPLGLKAALLRIPARIRRVWWRWDLGWRQAAAIVLLAGLAWASYVGHGWWRAHEQENHLASVISQIARLHVDRQPQVETGDTTYLITALRKPAYDVRATVMEPQNDVKLLGGGSLELDGHTIYFAKYRQGGRLFTLYQIDTDEFGLAEDFTHRLESVAGPGGRVTVEAWPMTWSRGPGESPDPRSAWFLVSNSPDLGQFVSAKEIVQINGPCR
jgi:hypothetical protein